MANLSKSACELLHDAGATEIADDYVVVGNTDVRILLSHRAVADLNAQARQRADDMAPNVQSEGLANPELDRTPGS